MMLIQIDKQDYPDAILERLSNSEGMESGSRYKSAESLCLENV